MTGQGGWPLNVFTRPRGRAVLRRHVLPARAAPRDAELPPGAGGRRRGVAHAPRTRSAPSAPRTVEGAERAGAGARARGGPRRAAVIDEAEQNAGRPVRPELRRLRRRTQVPAGLGARVPDAPHGRAGRRRRAGGKGAEIVTTTLERMAKGGIYDQVGGGFARYSVDAHWLVPHFEKMLYDNALLARAYLHAWQLTGDELFRRVCEETLDWALREMRGPEGGFYSALDADSEGEEGKFYVWTEDGAARAARRRRRRAAGALGRRPGAELRGAQHPARRPAGTSTRTCSTRARRTLYEVRAQRVWPGLDDKRLTAWNALMIAALADAGAVLGRADYLEAAAPVRPVPARPDARPRRPAAAHLQGRPCGTERLPRGPRIPARGAAGALRGHVRDALVHRGARARRHDDRALRLDPRAAFSTRPATTRR